MEFRHEFSGGDSFLIRKDRDVITKDPRSRDAHLKLRMEGADAEGYAPD